MKGYLNQKELEANVEELKNTLLLFGYNLQFMRETPIWDGYYYVSAIGPTIDIAGTKIARDVKIE